jgi:hypothetical protein
LSGSPFEMQCARCIPQETNIQNVRLATAYVPFQKFCGLWSPCMSLTTGTAFPELFSPYCKREFVNLEPEVSCLTHDHGECRPCGRPEGRPDHE